MRKERDGVNYDMIVNMSFVDVGCNDILKFPFEKLIGKLLPYFVRLRCRYIVGWRK